MTSDALEGSTCPACGHPRPKAKTLMDTCLTVEGYDLPPHRLSHHRIAKDPTLGLCGQQRRWHIQPAPLVAWFRPVKPVLLVIAAFALVFAVFDLAEVSHQVSASKTGLIAIATVVALLPLSTAGLSVAAFRSPDVA